MRRLVLLLIFLLLLPVPVATASRTHEPEIRAMATLSSRSCKPGSRVELVVTVRGASSPVIPVIDRPSELRISPLRRPRLVKGDSGAVWLFRYRVKALKSGDYEIAPIRVMEGGRIVESNPLFLHVSPKAEVMPFNEREFSHVMALPRDLCHEVLAAAPQPTPKPEPPPQPDTRPIGAKVLSTMTKGIVSFWNYPGKSSTP